MDFHIIEIPLEHIQYDHSFFRRHQQDIGITQLETSIDRHGQLVPIMATKQETEEGIRYRIVDGNRRFCALKRLKRSTIQAQVVEQATLAEAITVNTYHEDFNMRSIYLAVKKLLCENPKAEGKEIGIELNMRASEACKYIRLAQAIPEIQQAIEADTNPTEGISIAVARELVYQDQERQPDLLKSVLKFQKENNKRMTRKELEQFLKNPNSEPTGREQFHLLEAHIAQETGIRCSIQFAITKKKSQEIKIILPANVDNQLFIQLFNQDKGSRLPEEQAGANGIHNAV